MDQDKLASIRAALEAERDRLTHQLVDLGAPPESSSFELSVDEGFADSGQATAERSEVLMLVEELKSMYVEVVAALKRIEDGSYGLCERCGQPIPAERLEALPTARLCVTCKQAAAG